MDKTIEYRGFNITFSAKPIPSRNFDYDWTHKDYDGPGDNRCGASSSIEAAKRDIDDHIEDT